MSANAPQTVDRILRGARELATPIGTTPRAGAALGELRVIPQGAIAIRDGRIAAVGPESEILRDYRASSTLDAQGGTFVPGFVDAHTHPVFSLTREDEFEMRSKGATYLEIAAQGGGILSSVRGVRAATPGELFEALLTRLDRFLEHGTTTIEAKTGYGLSLEDELKSLEVIDAARGVHPVELVATFLGAHDFPPEFRERRDDYVRVVRDEMLPRVAESKLAEYCDVFVERHVFGLDASRSILERARALGLGLRVHADQLSQLGGAELAAELGAASADHLEFISDRGIDALASHGVIPVLCPVVPLYLRIEREAPGRRLIDSGLAPALSTDFNPGSCYLQSMPEVLSWAALRYRMSAAECLTAATLNAACSLGRGARIGTLEPGKEADVAVLDVPNHRHLVYELGRNPVLATLKSGRVVWRRGGTITRSRA